MKKFFSFAIIGMIAFSGLTMTGCGGSGENTVVEAEESPPPQLNEVQMDQYASEQAAQGQGNPGN